MFSLRFLFTLFSNALALLQRLGYSPQDLVREAQTFMRDYRADEATPVLTQASTRALSTALEEADGLGERVVRPVHILLGLVREEHGVAGRLLRDEGFTTTALRQTIGAVTDSPAQARSGLSEATEMVLRNALQASQRLGAPSVDTEHLLVGVLDANDARTRTVLNKLGFSEEILKSAAIRAVYEPPPPRIEGSGDKQGPIENQEVRIRTVDETLTSLAAELRTLRNELAQKQPDELSTADQALDDQTEALLKVLERYKVFLSDRKS